MLAKTEIPRLDSVKDLWTNTVDWFWTQDGKIISPYFVDQEKAHAWLKEHTTLGPYGY